MWNIFNAFKLVIYDSLRSLHCFTESRAFFPSPFTSSATCSALLVRYVIFYVSVCSSESEWVRTKLIYLKNVSFWHVWLKMEKNKQKKTTDTWLLNTIARVSVRWMNGSNCKTDWAWDIVQYIKWKAIESWFFEELFDFCRCEFCSKHNRNVQKFQIWSLKTRSFQWFTGKVMRKLKRNENFPVKESWGELLV